MTRAQAKKRCKAITLRNARCTFSTKPSSDFCGKHKYFRFRDVPWYRNTWFHLLTLALSILGVVVGVLGLNDNTEEIMQKMEIYHATNASLLAARYPLGYLLFTIHNNQITKWEPRDSKLRMDFNSARVEQVNSRVVRLSLPLLDDGDWDKGGVAFVRQTFLSPPRNTATERFFRITARPIKNPTEGAVALRITCPEVSIVRKEGAKGCTAVFGQPHEAWTEVLVNNQDHIICVHGMKENTFTSLSDLPP